MRHLIAAFALTVLAQMAAADTKPFNLSLTPDIAVQERTDRIEGLALSVWGENEQKALAIGFVNGSTGASSGLSLGLLNYSAGYQGLQLGFVNLADGDFTGWQDAFVNYTEGEMHGLQTGWLNYAGRLRGLQLGLVNYADKVTAGLQIGLLNFMPETEQWFADMPDAVAPAMILVNWRF